jgi:CRP/FNR family transcriptional regulator
LSAEFAAEVRKSGLVRHFKAGEILWTEGAPAQAMHVVLHGEVRVVRVNRGRQRVLHREARGGTLGDVALFSDESYPATAIAETAVTTLALTRATLHALIGVDANFGIRLLNRLALRVRHVLGVIDRMTAWSVQARVAQHLLERAARTTAPSFTLGMTQQALAEELGTVREVIVRALGDLKDAGCIENAARGRYRLVDGEALRRAAQPLS